MTILVITLIDDFWSSHVVTIYIDDNIGEYIGEHIGYHIRDHILATHPHNLISFKLTIC